MSEQVMTIDGVDELVADVEKAFELCPMEMDKAMRKTANGWKKAVSDQFPYESYGSNEHSQRIRANGTAKITKPFKKMWKASYDRGVYGYIEEATVTNTSPLWHLVENGHREVLFGIETGGFVAGRHFKDKANAEYEDKYPENLDKAATKALTEADLL